jgi:hypothetical protein
MTSFAIKPSVVTLNLFQGPSLRPRRPGVGKRNRAVAFFHQSTVLAARWMLKQVQHDEEGRNFS